MSSSTGNPAPTLPLAPTPPPLGECLAYLGLRPDRPDELPFGPGDATAGCENELQVAVRGARADVDLAGIIEGSRHYASARRRAARGDILPVSAAALEHFLTDNAERTWEHSWVRLPLAALGSDAHRVLERDLLADKRDPSAGIRSDAERFFLERRGERWLRVPVSYLLKLSLARCLASSPEIPLRVRQRGLAWMGHFLNDNTQPETHSFHVVGLDRAFGGGAALARETGLRFLLTQLLVQYANQAMGLAEAGQEALVFSSPHPPLRQQRLNACISDAFYRELFMSPCLSGWDRGQEKHAYMGLCHQVLTRSRLGTLTQLRDAGILTSNLVVPPTLSSTALLNNGTHVSLGSRRLGRRLAGLGGSPSPHEKAVADLAVKIQEHFLPLLVGTVSADPYRLDFADFHPEVVLGFLPHELHHDHLRQFWWRWRHKARNRIFGRPMTPFGPPTLDRMLGRALALRGDLVPDFRLIDYLTCLPSTPMSPALDGSLGNTDRLQAELDERGIFDARMSTYLLVKPRLQHVMGFSGFEARHYSLFPSLGRDMALAVDLQRGIAAVALHWIAEGRYDHAAIPDTPEVESERRQAFFGTAVGLRAFTVDPRHGNQVLADILTRTRKTRGSGRYQGTLKVYLADYQQALLETLAEQGRPVVEALGLQEALADLGERLRDPRAGAAARLTAGIAGGRDPFDLDATAFNSAAERWYRDGLRLDHQEEGLAWMLEELDGLGAGEHPELAELASASRGLAGPGGHRGLVARARLSLRGGSADPETLRRLTGLCLLAVRAHEHLHTTAPVGDLP